MSTEQPQSLHDVAPRGFGALLADVHAAFDDGFVVPPGGEAWTIDVDVLTGHTDRWLRRTYAELPEEAAVLTAWRDAARAVIAEVPSTDDGLCHGEAYPATCRFDGGMLSVAELDWSGAGPRVYDLATYRWVLELHVGGASAASMFDELVDGYASRRTVPDLRALDGWVAARHLWSLRLAAGFAPTRQLVQRAELARRWQIGDGGD